MQVGAMIQPVYTIIDERLRNRDDIAIDGCSRDQVAVGRAIDKIGFETENAVNNRPRISAAGSRRRWINASRRYPLPDILGARMQEVLRQDISRWISLGIDDPHLKLIFAGRFGPDCRNFSHGL